MQYIFSIIPNEIPNLETVNGDRITLVKYDTRELWPHVE